MLVQIKSGSANNLATILYHPELANHNDQEDQLEAVVVEESVENVELTLTKLPCVDDVENSHHHKGLEDHCVKHALVSGCVKLVSLESISSKRLQNTVGTVDVLLSPEFRHEKWLSIIVFLQLKELDTEEEDRHKDRDLVNSMTDNVSPHD